MAQQRMSVREAAELLGISPDGVRMRIKRGSMESERDDEGHIWVWVNTASREPNSGERHSEAEVEALNEQIAYLRSVIDQRDHELQRAHQLVAESLHQLRALNPPADHEQTTDEQSHTSASQPPTSDPVSESPEPNAEPQTGAQRRSWWRRLFGG